MGGGSLSGRLEPVSPGPGKKREGKKSLPGSAQSGPPLFFRHGTSWIGLDSRDLISHERRRRHIIHMGDLFYARTNASAGISARGQKTSFGGINVLLLSERQNSSLFYATPFSGLLPFLMWFICIRGMCGRGATGKPNPGSRNKISFC